VEGVTVNNTIKSNKGYFVNSAETHEALSLSGMCFFRVVLMLVRFVNWLGQPFKKLRLKDQETVVQLKALEKQKPFIQSTTRSAVEPFDSIKETV